LSSSLSTSAASEEASTNGSTYVEEGIDVPAPCASSLCIQQLQQLSDALRNNPSSVPICPEIWLQLLSFLVHMLAQKRQRASVENTLSENTLRILWRTTLKAFPGMNMNPMVLLLLNGDRTEALVLRQPSLRQNIDNQVLKCSSGVMGSPQERTQLVQKLFAAFLGRAAEFAGSTLPEDFAGSTPPPPVPSLSSSRLVAPAVPELPHCSSTREADLPRRVQPSLASILSMVELPGGSVADARLELSGGIGLNSNFEPDAWT
jgi:hypothetical protein